MTLENIGNGSRAVTLARDIVFAHESRNIEQSVLEAHREIGILQAAAEVCIQLADEMARTLRAVVSEDALPPAIPIVTKATEEDLN